MVPRLGLRARWIPTSDGSPAFRFRRLVRSQPLSATLTAKMMGDWRNPMERRGLTVSDLANRLELPAGLPGIAGTVAWAAIWSRWRVRFDLAEPVILAYLRTL